MAAIHITRFAGIMPELSARLKSVANAQIAHNCLLTDGALRPQAQWREVRSYDDSTALVGISYDLATDAVYAYGMVNPVNLVGEPFAKDLVVGAGHPQFFPGIRYCTVGAMSTLDATVPSEPVLSNISYTRSYDSIKPVNRVYAFTRVRYTGGRAEEGPLVALAGQQPTDIVYEGDLVDITLDIGYSEEASHIRLYRSISGLDTGENVTNPLDTKWHLVSEIPLSTTQARYIDGESATASPLDLCYSQNFHGIQILPHHFGMTESGWFVAANNRQEIQISERYMHHAWPVDNHIALQGEKITAIAVHKDNVYVGTEGKPYIVSISSGESATQVSAVAFPESIPCNPGSMAAAAGGAIYASGQGLVALSREGQRVISRDIVNAGDILYRKRVTRGTEELEVVVSMEETTFGAYYQGVYYGFAGIEHEGGSN